MREPSSEKHMLDLAVIEHLNYLMALESSVTRERGMHKCFKVRLSVRTAIVLGDGGLDRRRRRFEEGR